MQRSAKAIQALSVERLWVWPSLLLSKRSIRALLELLLEPRTVCALLSWPKFSLTSFQMVSGLLKQGVLPSTVIDVGANVGQFAVAAARLFPAARIHSFEPLPDAARRLRENVKRLKNVTIYPIALGDSEGDIAFHVNSYSHSSSVLPLAQGHRNSFPWAREVETIRVRASSLDRVLGSIALPPPVLLKLDVQGYEATTLRGGVDTLKRVDYAVIETSFKPMYEGEVLFPQILRLMETYGFGFVRPVGWLSDPRTGGVLQMDALFERRQRPAGEC